MKGTILTNEQVRQQLMELKLKDLTPDTFDLLFNHAFAKVFQDASLEGVLKVIKATQIIQKKPATSRKPKPAPKPKKAKAVDGTEPKGNTKSERALWVIRQHAEGLKASQIAELTNDKKNLVYPMLSNLKNQGKIVLHNGHYFAVQETP